MSNVSYELTARTKEQIKHERLCRLHGVRVQRKYLSIDSDLNALADSIQDICEDWYTGCEGLCAGFTTHYRSGYDDVLNVIKNYSKVHPFIVFRMDVYDSDDEDYLRIHISNGEHEVMQGCIEYDAPQKIFFY